MSDCSSINTRGRMVTPRVEAVYC